MEDKEETNEIKSLIINDMHLQEEKELLEADNINMLKEKLVKMINTLLQNDYHRLVNAMYRLDVDEKKFREVFSGLHSPNVASRLADLVIARELAKINTRKKFRS